jgi:hypothetical protein
MVKCQRTWFSNPSGDGQRGPDPDQEPIAPYKGADPDIGACAVNRIPRLARGSTVTREVSIHV